MASIDELFIKRIPVNLKFQERESRKTGLHIAIEMHTITTPVHKKELVVRLTDESDLLFLYLLHLSEEDFQTLKCQQGLLVDFVAFPQKFVDLLELCVQEEHKENPKFILELSANGTGTGCTANLNVIETNPFKHLTHLSLKFLPGTDTDIKKYLAICLKTLKDQNGSLLSRLEQTESSLSGQLREAREALAGRSTELESLRAEWNAKTSEIQGKHRSEVNSERERALQTQTSLQQRYDREKRELEVAHTKIVKQLETRLYELETSNKDLLDRKYQSEASIRELSSKLSGLEEEHRRARQELSTLRQNNAGLDSDYHQQDKVINQLRTSLAVLQQEVKDKDALNLRSQELYTSEQQSKVKAEEEIERKKRHIGKLESSVKTMSEELVKGNEIIKKLQAEIKNYHTKLKLRSQVTTEQEKLLGEKNREMEEVRKQLEEVKLAFSGKEAENEKLNVNLETTMSKLEESRQLLKTNENVINWLNKQVTENQLGISSRPGVSAGAFEMNSTANSLGYRAGIHNYSAVPRSGSGDPNVASLRSEISPAIAGLGYMNPRSTKVVHYQPSQTLPQLQRNHATPLAKSSPLDTTLPHNVQQGVPGVRDNNHASPQLPPNVTHSASAPLLDTKYFQKSSDVPLRRDNNASVNPQGVGTSIHFSTTASTGTTIQHPHPLGSAGIMAQAPSVPSVNNPTRLDTNTIVPRGMQGTFSGTSQSQQQQAPLASAYFPPKVT